MLNRAYGRPRDEELELKRVFRVLYRFGARLALADLVEPVRSLPPVPSPAADHSRWGNRDPAWEFPRRAVDGPG